MKERLNAAKLGNPKIVYHCIITLAIFLHFSQAVIYALLSCPIVAVYNGLSVAFYFLMQLFVRKEWFRTVVSSIHIEVCLFVIVTVFCCGWSTGAGLYLFAISSLVYFCPYDRKYVPYIFSSVDVILFLILKLYSDFVEAHCAPMMNPVYLNRIYLFNALACGLIILLAAMLSNITASVTNKRLLDENKSLSKMANYDMLTGLMTRRYFLSLVNRSSNRQAAAALGDIDNFKTINDTYGHAAGDYILNAVASRIKAQCPPETLLCRWGGEEFVFYFSGMDPDDVVKQLDAVRDCVDKEPFFNGDTKIHISMTIGVAWGDSFDIAIKRADSRMYMGKKSSKNKVVSTDLN